MTTSARTEDGTWQQAITNAPASGCHLSHTNIAVFSSIPVGETEEILASNSAIQNQNLWRRLVRAPPIRFLKLVEPHPFQRGILPASSATVVFAEYKTPAHYLD